MACGGARPWSFPACATALRPRPAAANPASTGSRKASRNPDTGPLHTTLRNQPPPRARRTLPPIWTALGRGPSAVVGAHNELAQGPEFFVPADDLAARRR